MTLTLPPLLDDMVAALNAHDADAFLVCFARDPIVRDEGKAHYGEHAVRAWFAEVVLRYRPAFEVAELGYADGEPVLTGAVSGTFDGSPIRLRFFCGIEDGKIVALKIAP